MRAGGEAPRKWRSKGANLRDIMFVEL